MQDKDFEARDLITKDIHTNYFVEAGAGSGKTTVLVQRLISMVKQGLDISKICAITFTKAAAGEFYSRFQAALANSENENAKEALNKIDLCFMGTIDAFCKMILSEHPSYANIPSNAKIVDEKELKNFFLSQYIKISKGELGKDLKDKCDLFKKYNKNCQEIFVQGNVLNFLRSTRNISPAIPKLNANSLKEILGDKIDSIKHIFKYLYNHKEFVNESEKKSTEAWKSLDENIKILDNSWDENIFNIFYFLKKLLYIRISSQINITEMGLYASQIFEPKLKKGEVEYWYLKKEGDPLCVEEIQNFQSTVAINFINYCVDPINENMKKQGILDFTDCLLLLRDMLKNDAERDGSLIKHIYNKHSYFLIDEFQDTNPVQAEIFFYLTSQNIKKEWQNNIPYPGSLFVVGDPKQSIYRFRNADVYSYLQVKKLFTGKAGKVLYLTRNFRSTDIICEWFNNCFSKLLPENTSMQSKYELIPLGEKPKDISSIKGAFCCSYDYVKKLEGRPEWEILAKTIRQLVDNPQCSIFDKGKCRRINYQDFMIITPNKSHLPHIINALNNWNIDVNIEGKVLFSKCSALFIIYHIINAIMQKDSFNSYLYAKTMSNIDISQDDFDFILKFSIKSSPSSLFFNIVEKLEIFKYVDTKYMEYIYYVFEIIKNMEVNKQIICLEDLLNYLKQILFEEKSSQERSLKLNENSNAVKLANLHKVKGLEAPIVILADPAKTKVKAVTSVNYQEKPAKSYIFGIEGKGGFNSQINNNFYEEQKQIELDNLNAELTRLLYVAATRAKNAVIILKPMTKKGEASNYWKDLLDLTVTDIKNVVNINAAKVNKENKAISSKRIYEQFKQTNIFNNNCSTKSSFSILKPSEDKYSEDNIDAESMDDPSKNYNEFCDTSFKNKVEENSFIKNNPALIGSIVHRFLQCIVESNYLYNKNMLINQVLNEFDANNNECVQMLNDIENKMLNGGYSQENFVEDLFAELKNADEVHCETPFYYAEQNKICNGIIDLLYRKDDCWYIVDYKTNQDGTNLVEKYKNQLEQYKKIMQKQTDLEIKTFIYHLNIK